MSMSLGVMIEGERSKGQRETRDDLGTGNLEFVRPDSRSDA